MRAIKKFAWYLTVGSIILNIYIYTYPSLDSSNCSWAFENKFDSVDIQSLQWKIMEVPYFGDLYKTYILKNQRSDGNNGKIPRDIHFMAVGDPQLNGNWPNTPMMKRLDNLGNDYYLGHIYKLMKNRLDPQFVCIMGDIVSSQWTGDSEFYNRTRRILTRSFPRPEGQCSAELTHINKHEDMNWVKDMEDFEDQLYNGGYEDEKFFSYQDIYDWTNGTFIDPKTGYNTEPLFLNVTGNHDIGYGDTTYQHMSRWWKLYGKDNFWIEYDNDTDHPWRIVMLNSLALDGPMLQPQLQDYVWQFVNVLKNREYKGSTILLTHIPMHKREGLCYDGPFFEYYKESGCHGCSPSRVGLLKSQNFLSPETSQKIMDAVFGSSKSGIILTGHDHNGCDNYFNYLNEEEGWVADKKIKSDKWIREITVRSIMGDYDGTIGLMTGQFNPSDDKWDFEYTQCKFTVQHVWWAAQIITLLALLFQSISIFL